jgi:putative nucleotidyltransferase with HDIG domain
MDAVQVQKKLESIHDLPTLPVIVVELNRMLQDHGTAVEELIETIEKDPAIVLKLLKLVNSAFYGFRSQISSLHQAVVLLGFNTVRNAVLSVSIINAFKDADQLEGFDMNEFWQHSVAVAVTSKHLAKTTALASPDDSFVAGLLHDVGKIILFQFFRDLFEKVWKHMQANQKTFFVSENESSPVDHAMIGGMLTRKWQLPEDLVDTIGFHHQPHPDSETYRMQALICLADTIVHHFAEDPGYPMEDQKENFKQNIWEAVEVPAAEAHEWYPQLSDDIAAACDLVLGQGHTCRQKSQVPGR